MDSSIFLAKFYGIVFIAVGLSILINGRSFNKIIKDYARHPQTVLFDGVFRVMLGSFLVLYHNVWEASFVGVVTVMGWIILIKGLLALLLPSDSFEKLVKRFKNQKWYVGGGLLLVLVGIYFAVNGFGIVM